MHTSQILVKHREGTGEVFGGNTVERVHLLDGFHHHHTTLQECDVRKKNPLHFNLTPVLMHFCICRVFAGQRVLSPVPEHWPGGCEAQPLHQCQLRPRLQCLPELLCCDRYNTTRTRSSAKRVNTAAAGQRQLHRDCQASRVLLDCFVILSQPHITDSSR